MALARLLWLPYRIFIEIFFATAAFLFFRSLAVWTRLGIVSSHGPLYALLLFHPVLVLEINRAMSDPVSVLCWLAVVWNPLPDSSPRPGTGFRAEVCNAIVSFAFAGITRSGEGAIFVFVEERLRLRCCPYFCFAARIHGVDAVHRRCLCAGIANLATTQALSAWHFVNSGYWGRFCR